MRRVCLWLLCALFIMGGRAGAREAAPAFELAASNARYALYVLHIPNERLDFMVKDLRTGDAYYASPEGWPDSAERNKRTAMGSQLIVTSADAVTTAQYTANSLAASVREGGARVDMIPGGFRVTYDFSRKKDRYIIPVEYVLTDDGLRARILFTEIVEYGDCMVTSVAFLPYMGAAPAQSEGYILVPDGCGALIDLNGWHKGFAAYRQIIYGKDASLTVTQKMGRAMTAALPVLGIKNGRTAVFAMISQGAAFATAYAFPSGADSSFSTAYFDFTYRASDTLVMADKTWASKNVTLHANTKNDTLDICVDYSFLSDAQADYMGMAQVCRKALFGNDADRRARALPGINLDVYCGVKEEQSLLGFMVKRVLPMTTFDKARGMLEALSDSGVSPVHMRLFGWEAGGLQDAVRTAPAVESALGGRKGLERLIASSRQAGGSLSPDVDFLRFYKQTLTYGALNAAARRVTGDVAEQRQFLVSTYQPDEQKASHYLLSGNALPGVLERYARAYPYERLSLDSFGSLLYSDYRLGKGYVSREEMARTLADLAEALRTGGLTLVTGYGYAYMLPYVSAVMDVPLFDSGYDLTACDVPFYQLVLRGYVDMYAPAGNQTENPRRWLLRLLETGVNPSYIVTDLPAERMRRTDYAGLISTAFDTQQARIVADYMYLQEAMARLGNAAISDYRILSPLVRQTTYDNGMTVVVNYGAESVPVDGVWIAPMDFGIWEAMDVAR